MGSASSSKVLKKKSAFNNVGLQSSGIANKNSNNVNTRSISVPSYLASLQKKGDKINDIEGNPVDTSEKLTRPILSLNKTKQRRSEPNMINESCAAKRTLKPINYLPANGPMYSEPMLLPPKIDVDGSVVSDESLLTAKELYNILTAETWSRHPYLSNIDYLLLIDCRSEENYQASHIITAKHHTCLHIEYGCLIDVPGQLEAFEMIIVYGDTLEACEEILPLLKDRNNCLYKLHSSFDTFQDVYPFLCTARLIRSVEDRKHYLQTWPSEIIKGKIYQGNATHAANKDILQVLGITHIVNITLDFPNVFSNTIEYKVLKLDDEADVDLLSRLSETTRFIQNALNTLPESGELSEGIGNNRVLIHCNFGRSRSSTVVLGYLMENNRWSLKDACDWLKDCRPTVKPNIGFLNQLLLHEKKIFGYQYSHLHQLPF